MTKFLKEFVNALPYAMSISTVITPSFMALKGYYTHINQFGQVFLVFMLGWVLFTILSSYILMQIKRYLKGK